MGYFTTDIVGLIIAFLNTVTVLLLLHAVLRTAGESRGGVAKALDRVFSPILAPIRRILPQMRLDAAPVAVAVVLQVIALAIRRNFL
mgnify:CR=1 FL=1